MKSNYDFCLQQVLLSEGGYTNDPRDPGGATNYGITIEDYHLYINPKGTSDDVRNMTVDQAKAIYKSKYWDAVNGDNLPSGVDYTVFDYGVNSGVSRANSVYARLKQSDSVETINAINIERLAFLKKLPIWSVYGKGWSARVARVRSDSIRLANTPQSSSSLDDVASEITQATGIFSTVKNFATDNFKKHAAAATPVVAAGTSVSYTHYWPYYLAGAVVVGILVWLGIYLYERKRNA